MLKHSSTLYDLLLFQYVSIIGHVIDKLNLMPVKFIEKMWFTLCSA